MIIIHVASSMVRDDTYVSWEILCMNEIASACMSHCGMFV